MGSQDEFAKQVADANTFPLWEIGKVMGKASIQAHLWSWAEMRRLMFEAAEAHDQIEKGGERRALLLINPASRLEELRTSNSLVAAIQLIKPGEEAGAHRHTAMALRFIIEGSGAYTIVNGEKIVMEQGDLVITPQWAWHDHAYSGAKPEPMLWLDALDSPIGQFMNAFFIERYSRHMQDETVREGLAVSRLGAGLMRSPGAGPAERNVPMIYKWEPCYRALLETRDQDPCDGAILEYTNPVDGGHTLPSTACALQRLLPDQSGASHRHTSSTIYHVVRGEGCTTIDGREFRWTRGDTFVVPSWAVHGHANASAQHEAVLFSLSDKPVLEALNLYREEAVS